MYASKFAFVHVSTHSRVRGGVSEARLTRWSLVLSDGARDEREERKEDQHQHHHHSSSSSRRIRRDRPKWQKITYTTHTYPSKLVPSTYLRRKIGIQVHNITPRPLSRTRLSPTNLPKSVLEHCVITDLKHTIGGSAKVLLLSISP